MDHEVWQQLLSLESRDILQKWFENIHGRELNARRAREISASSRQAREFFRNASVSNYSVRPLLTFYGVASLARALSLLLRRHGGEEGLKRGHGLETVGWTHQLSGKISAGLEGLGGLRVRTCSGLFSDLAKETNNRISIHVRSSGVDWRLNYRLPNFGDEISLKDLMARVPDLNKDYKIVSDDIKYSAINEMTYDSDTGFKAKVAANDFEKFKNSYEDMGYKIERSGDLFIISGTSERFSENTPQFMHAYIDKLFETIPRLFIVAPFPGGNVYSQLCITYIFSYILGMLARYYPTHWISLIQGEKGDALWPTINRAQRFVEQSFPELAIELIADVLAHPEQA